MRYILQALDWLEPLTFALGAVVGFWGFRRCRKIGYLIVAVYFCLGLFSLLAMPRINAELRARRTPTQSDETQRKIDAAMSEAMERVMREEGESFQPPPMERSIRFPFGPLVLVLGVWLLARREPRVPRSDMVSETQHDHTTA